MGQKTDRINELEANRGAAMSLIRSIGEMLDVEVGDDVTPTNAPRYMARFAAAVHDRQGDSEALPGDRLPQFTDMDAEIDRANEGREGREGHALARRPGDSALRERSAASTVIEDIAHELDLDVSGLPAQEALAAIYAKLLRIKNPSGDIGPEVTDPALSKGDTFAEAMAHNAGERRHLGDELTRARTLLSRIASAMQVETWDADGTELLEKVQRWDTFRVILKRRIAAFEEAAVKLEPPGRTLGAHEISELLAGEFRSLLSSLVSTREFLDFTKNKPKSVVSGAVLEASIAAPSRRFNAEHLALLLTALDSAWPQGLRGSFFSPVVSSEFIRLMNLIILPLVERYAQATGG